MKTVYVAERGYEHEGFEIIGVFETMEEAQEAIKKDEEEDRGDYHMVEDFILGEKMR